MAPDLTPAQRRGIPHRIMETNHGSRIPDAKELPQPQGIETRELPAIPPGTNMRGPDDGPATLAHKTALILAIAAVCHDANRRWCIVNGDRSQQPWESAPEWQRQSAVEGVRAALAGATPEELHESWCLAKRRDGWVYGVEKNAATKEHPCLVPYDQLPPEQRRKDHLFRAIVTALAEEG